MKIAVIVVSYNIKELLRTCIRSIYASFQSAAGDDDELVVIVVDSASSDRSAAMIETEFPQVILLAQDDNIGFVAGNNLAMQHLGFTNSCGPTGPRTLSTAGQIPDVVLLLNPDAQLVDDALWQMARFLMQNPHAGVSGAHLEYGNGAFQHGAFRFPSLSQVLIDVLPMSGLPGLQRIQNSWLNGRFAQALWRSQEPFEVDFVLGAALMVRGDAIQLVGALDPAYVMYCEEMDWCLRIGEAGYKIYAIPFARVVHHEGQSSRQRRWETYVRLWRSRFQFYRKHRSHYPRGYTLIVRMILHIGLQWRASEADKRFARGAITGCELAEELCAYSAVRQL